MIQKNICEKQLDDAIEFVKSKALFSSVYKSSVESFRDNFKPESADVAAEHSQPENRNE